MDNNNNNVGGGLPADKPKRKTHTSNAVKNRYRNKTYKNYAISMRLIDDADLIDMIESAKTETGGTTEAFRKLLQIAKKSEKN